MQCPDCQSRLLKVGVSFTGAVSCHFGENNKFRLLEKVSLNSDFPDDAVCRCLKCDWEGYVFDIRVDTAHLKRKPARQSGSLMSEEELDRIAEAVRGFDPRAKQISQRLIQEVQRLRSLLESVSRVSKTGNDDDTRIG